MISTPVIIVACVVAAIVAATVVAIFAPMVPEMARAVWVRVKAAARVAGSVVAFPVVCLAACGALALAVWIIQGVFMFGFMGRY